MTKWSEAKQMKETRKEVTERSLKFMLMIFCRDVLSCQLFPFPLRDFLQRLLTTIGALYSSVKGYYRVPFFTLVFLGLLGGQWTRC